MLHYEANRFFNGQVWEGVIEIDPDGTLKAVRYLFGIASKKQHHYLRSLEVTLSEYEHGLTMMVKNDNGEDYNDFVYSVEPPCLVKVAIEPKPGWRLIASDYFVPLTENQTRLFVFEARD